MRTIGTLFITLQLLFGTGCLTTKTATLELPPQPTPDSSPAAKVTRSEVIAIAESYRTFTWQPSAANRFHGTDANGIRVDTPDDKFKPGGDTRPGWWQPNQVNVGIPYQWGGFDSVDSFAAGIKAGKYAGDIYTKQKRKLLDDGVSSEACGVDCSGFVSRCWRLDRSWSTRELPQLCSELKSFSDLKKGDIANKSNDHVLIFEHWLNEERSQFMAYETGSPPTWKVLRHPISVEYIRGLGYKPYRYRNIED